MFDVAVVGFGPVGAVAANLLGRANLKAVVIDRSDEVYEKPRAIAFDHEVMRVFQNIGVADQIRSHLGAYVPTDFIGVDGRPIARFASKPGPSKQGWDSNYVFDQPEVEKIVRHQAAQLDGVSFFLNHEVVGADQAADYSLVSLSLRGRSGETTTLQATYVIACDGANSFLRKLLGIQLETLNFDKPFLVADLLVKEPALSRLPAVNVQDCNPERPSTYIIGPGSHRRWEIMLDDDEGPRSSASDEMLPALLERWLQPDEATILRAATYSFHALYARQFHVGHIFLAGDAAHQTPPFMGQGMAQGIRDVVNLTWKLSHVLRGFASPTLLDTYQDERIRHVVKTTQRAVDLGRVICERDPRKAADRDAAMREANGDPPAVQYRQDLIPPLDTGFASPALPNISGELALQPNILLKDGRKALLDDISKAGFQLLARQDFGLSANIEHLRCLSEMDIQLFIFANAGQPADTYPEQLLWSDNGAVDAWLRDVGCDAVLVRPDHYIYGGLTAWASLEPMLDDLKRYLGTT